MAKVNNVHNLHANIILILDNEDGSKGTMQVSALRFERFLDQMGELDFEGESGTTKLGLEEWLKDNGHKQLMEMAGYFLLTVEHENKDRAFYLAAKANAAAKFNAYQRAEAIKRAHHIETMNGRSDEIYHEVMEQSQDGCYYAGWPLK